MSCRKKSDLARRTRMVVTQKRTTRKMKMLQMIRMMMTMRISLEGKAAGMMMMKGTPRMMPRLMAMEEVMMTMMMRMEMKMTVMRKMMMKKRTRRKMTNLLQRRGSERDCRFY
uniref:Uncharacterized protein n=1 Tax=Opuntia streptacantha TaxID=393608 RepID=A0A7C8YGW7_OPUST